MTIGGSTPLEQLGVEFFGVQQEDDVSSIQQKIIELQSEILRYKEMLEAGTSATDYKVTPSLIDGIRAIYPWVKPLQKEDSSGLFLFKVRHMPMHYVAKSFAGLAGMPNNGIIYTSFNMYCYDILFNSSNLYVVPVRSDSIEAITDKKFYAMVSSYGHPHSHISVSRGEKLSSFCTGSFEWSDLLHQKKITKASGICNFLIDFFAWLKSGMACCGEYTQSNLNRKERFRIDFPENTVKVMCRLMQKAMARFTETIPDNTCFKDDLSDWQPEDENAKKIKGFLLRGFELSSYAVLFSIFYNIMLAAYMRSAKGKHAMTHSNIYRKSMEESLDDCMRLICSLKEPAPWDFYSQYIMYCSTPESASYQAISDPLRQLSIDAPKCLLFCLQQKGHSFPELEKAIYPN